MADSDLEQQLQAALEVPVEAQDVLEPTFQHSTPDEPISQEQVSQDQGSSTEDQGYVDPAPGESVSTAYLEKLKQRGIDLTGQYKSDDDVIDAFVNQRELLGRQSEFVHLGRALKENPGAVIARYAPEFGYAPQQQQVPVQQQQYKEPERQAPVTVETLTEWNRAVVRDEEGNITAVRPGYDPNVAHRLREYEQRALRTQQEFLLDPDNFIMQRAQAVAPQQEQIRELIAREIQQRNEVAREESKAVGFFQENKDWLVDPATGQLSNNGREFYHYMQEGMQQGIPERNTDGLVRYAVKSLQARYLGQQQQQRQVGQPAARARQQAVSRSGVSAHAPVKVEGEFNKGEDLETALLRNLGL